MPTEKIQDVVQGDVLTFKVADGNYKVLLCTSTDKSRSPYCFVFAALTYDNVERPTVEDIYRSSFYGIGNRKREYFSFSEQELERIWTFHPNIKPYDLSSYELFIWRKDFMTFRDNFEIVGNINIVDNLDKNSSGGMNASSWTVLQRFFNQEYKTILPYRGQTPFNVKAIVKT